MNILIVGGGLQALSVARSLKKERYSVIALLHRGDISTKSKYIDELYTIDITPTYKRNICLLYIVFCKYMLFL